MDFFTVNLELFSFALRLHVYSPACISSHGLKYNFLSIHVPVAPKETAASPYHSILCRHDDYTFKVHFITIGLWHVHPSTVRQDLLWFLLHLYKNNFETTQKLCNIINLVCCTLCKMTRRLMVVSTLSQLYGDRPLSPEEKHLTFILGIVRPRVSSTIKYACTVFKCDVCKHLSKCVRMCIMKLTENFKGLL